MISERKLRQLFADHGFTVHEIRRYKHWVVKASRPGGAVERFAAPLTPSDWRSIKNLEADLKRGYRRHLHGVTS